jgi:diguanylate cyclase (GGDEF)-like protein
VNHATAAAIAGLPTSELVTLSPRFAAGVGAAVVCGLLVLVWAYRRRPFILFWALAWGLASAALVLVHAADEGNVLSMVRLSLGAAAAVTAPSLFLDGIRRFGGDASWRRPATLLLGTFIVFFALPEDVPTMAVFAAAFLVMSGFLATAAWQCWGVATRRRMWGATVMAVAFVVVVATDTATAAVVAWSSIDAVAAPTVLAINVAAYALIAFGQHLFVFEDMLIELGESSRDLLVTKAELQLAAITDALTLLYNRRLFDEVAVRHVEHHRRFHLPLSLIYVDVDRFKAINDTQGHAAGDRVLRHVADYIRRQVREADYVFRLGGDEFAVLISCGAEEAEGKARDLQTGFRATLVEAGLPTYLGLSVGIAGVPANARNLDRTLQQADARMYDDKRRRATSALGA